MIGIAAAPRPNVVFWTRVESMRGKVLDRCFLSTDCARREAKRQVDELVTQEGLSAEMAQKYERSLLLLLNLRR